MNTVELNFGGELMVCTVACAHCGEEALAVEYPFCSEGCDKAYHEDHEGKAPRNLITTDGRLLGPLVGMGF